jgi:hypothetical protein
MYKYLLIITFVFSATTAHAFDYERSPSGEEVTNPISISLDFVDASDLGMGDQSESTHWVGLYIFSDIGYPSDYWGSCQNIDGQTHLDFTETFPFDNAVAISLMGAETQEDCEDPINGYQWQGAYIEGSYGGPIIFSIGADEPEVSTFQGMIDNGDTVMTNTVGENMSASVVSAGNNFYKPFLGGGLALLYTLRWWIVALVVFSALIYFSYRVFGMQYNRINKT